MAGGLIQIATYGNQDLYLTGNPEITFFKVVYRRHTNFAIESIRVAFDDPTGFGKTASLTLPKTGDAIHKTYLEILLPEMNLQRFTNPTDIQNAQLAYNTANANYQTTLSFMSINARAYVGAFNEYIPVNITDSSLMIVAINNVFNEIGVGPVIDSFTTLLAQTPNAQFTYPEISMQSVASAFAPGDLKNLLFSALSVALDKSIKTQEYFFNIYNDAKKALADAQNTNIKFAWVNRVGHAIINSIEVNIGGHKIDVHYGDWINIWYELTAHRDLEPIYFKLIGNVPELTDFNRVVKPQYLLRVPLQFWFCRSSGLALPLISLQYQDVTFNVTFRNIEDVSYVEFGQPIKIIANSTTGGILLSEVPGQLKIDMQATLLVDYIYLDGPERRRFAQSSHEYLIDQLQYLETRNITQTEYNVVLNNFVHSCKELIWVTQKERYTENLDGFTKLQWDNYSMTDAGKGNPILFSSMDFHSYNRIAKQDGNYFNYVQPYETHQTTPSDGINMYSFSLFPEEDQPSGSANFTRLSRVTLFLEFAQQLLLNVDTSLLDPIIFRIYARNVNILRFAGGFGALAFAYG